MRPGITRKGWESWREEEADIPSKVSSKDSSCEMVSPIQSSKSSPKIEEDSSGKEPKSELAQMLKVVMDHQQKTVELVLKQTTKGSM
jgi:hypothetical protein